jgi:hypothetical protein
LLAIVFLGIAAAYLGALIVLDGDRGPPRISLGLVLTAAGLFQVTLVYLPGMFSQDVFSYIAYGRLAATYQLNPYIWPPSAVSTDAAMSWVAAIWRSYPCPYGPIWVDVQWAMARLFGEGSMANQAIAYRWLANVLLVANLGLLWAVLGRLTLLSSGQRTTAVAALAWNPLVLFEVAANAHNDVLMVSFSLLALLLLARQKGASGLAGMCFTAGALVKYLSGIGLVWVAVASIARAVASPCSFRQRLLPLIGLLAACGTLVIVATLPWLELPDSLEPILAETATVGYVNSLPDSLALAVADRILAPAGVQQARSVARAVERLVILAAFGVYLLWEVRRVWRDTSPSSVARACARSCLVYVLIVSTSVQTWYFYLPVALALGLGWRNSLARVAVGYSLLALPALYLSYYLRDSTPLGVQLVYGLAPIAPTAIAAVVRRIAPRSGRSSTVVKAPVGRAGTTSRVSS